MLPRILKAHYLFFFGALGVYMPHLPAWFRARDLTGTEVGVVLAILPLLKIVVPALTGPVADRRGLGRTVLRVSAVGSFVAAIGLGSAEGFWAIAAWMTLFGIFRAPAPPIADAFALKRLPAFGVPFGQVRLMGTVGFLVVVVATGPLLNRLGIDAAPALMAALLAGTAVAAALFPPTAPAPAGVRVSAGGLLRSNHRFRRLMLCTVLHSMVLSAGVQFLPIHLEELGHPPSVSSWGWMLGVLVEIAVLHFADAILGRLGLVPCILLSYGVTALRWAGTALAVSAPALIAVQALHGIAFGLFFIATVHLVQELVGEHEAGTAQSLYSAASFGLGAILGLVLFGRGFDWLGGDAAAGRTLYAGAAALEVGVVALTAALLVGRDKVPPPGAEPAPDPPEQEC